ncbi:MAG: ATP-binding cassette domain-containing protein [Candidatus Omnitrophica bacterium]|nr:ATP-binding cassette domain-containing protein [Candidatus Omnitrophota bacterium]
MIKFERITLRYKNKEVFSNLTLEIQEGEKAVISGYSGLGKSSLFYLLLGFVRPAEGTVYFSGRPLNSHSIWNVRRKISYVDQDISLFGGKIRQQFEFLFSLRANSHLSKGWDYIIELLNYFSLGRDILDKDIEEVSGGQRQRIALINAILLRRNVFLLDEPTSFLDEKLKEKVADFFLQRPYTVIVASHDQVWQKKAVKVFDLEKKQWVQ